MRVFDFLFGKKKKEIGNEAEKIVTLDELIKILKDKEDVDVLRESTYFICLKVLSEAVGKLPLKAYRKTENGGKEEVEHEALYVLSKRPNKFQSASVFWATVEMCRNHFGNAYVYLEHDRRGVLKNMYILDNSKMRVFVDNMGYLGGINEVYYQYSDANGISILKSDELLHFRTSLSLDGILGLSVQEQLFQMIRTSKEGETYMNNLLEKGLTANAVLEYTADLGATALDKVMDNLKKYGNGVKNVNGFIPIPPGFSLKPLNLTLNDVQFLDNKKFTSQMIAGAFGVKPYLYNDYEAGSHNSNEQQSLSFLVDTLMFILKHYEEEIDFKILDINSKKDKGIFYRFNEKAILRLTAKEQMEVLRLGVNNAIYKPNEARNYINLDATDGGDVLICNGNYIPVTEVGNQYKDVGNQYKDVGRGDSVGEETDD